MSHILLLGTFIRYGWVLSMTVRELVSYFMYTVIIIKHTLYFGYCTSPQMKAKVGSGSVVSWTTMKQSFLFGYICCEPPGWVISFNFRYCLLNYNHILPEKLLVLLRDGRKLMGTLRSFDQFGSFLFFQHSIVASWGIKELSTYTVFYLSSIANAVLEGACERVIVGDLYCDIPLGLYVIRGENVVLIGELVCILNSIPTFWCECYFKIP